MRKVTIVIDLTAAQESQLEELLVTMTLEEKAAQIAAVPVQELLDDKGKLSHAQLEKHLCYGIGQIARLSGSLEVGPEQAAQMANEIQHFLTAETRLGIPAIVHEECLSGLMVRNATIFPQAIGLASTWQPSLAEQMTEVVRRQARAIGVHHCLSPVLDVAWDPRWGRTEETMGEDPYLVSRMTTAFVRGLQGDDLHKGVCATLKHFVGYSFSEGGRNITSAHIPRRELREIFLYPFEVAIREANAGAVMSAYHDIDGIPCSASRELLTDILRNEWGFDGVVVADYGTIDFLCTLHHTAADKTEAARQALEAGLDVELPTWNYYRQPLIEAVRDGKIEEKYLDRAVRRHLRLKFALGLFDDPFVDETKAARVFDMPTDRQLSREIARRSIVLLKNEKQLLPLSPDIESIAVVGPNADSKRNLSGDYSYPVHISDTVEGVPVVTVLQGIKAKLSDCTQVHYAPGCQIMSDSTEQIPEAVQAAQAADVVVAVVGDESGISDVGTTGEHRDRTEITLPGGQEELLKALYETGTPLVVVLINGRPLSSPWLLENVPAILEAWMPGEEGGHAVADVLFGDYNPGGKLPVSILHNAGQAPAPYNRRIICFKPYVFTPAEPLLPFGHGLSYTEFRYSQLQVTPDRLDTQDEVTISCTVENTGKVAGDEVVQLYFRDEVASISRPRKQLAGFARISLEPGESRQIIFTVPVEQLAFYDRQMRLVVEPGDFAIMIGSSSEDIRLEGSFTVLHERIVATADRRYATEVAIE